MAKKHMKRCSTLLSGKCRSELQWTITSRRLGWKWNWKSLSCVQLFVTPWTLQSMEVSRPEYWSEQPFPSPGDLPNPGIEPRSPALQADSLPAEPQGNLKNTGLGSHPFSSGSSQTRNLTGVSCIAGGFFTNWAIRKGHWWIYNNVINATDGLMLKPKLQTLVDQICRRLGVYPHPWEENPSMYSCKQLE